MVARELGGIAVIEEIETASSVTEDDCKNQWVPYSRLGCTFRLVVPLDQIGLAPRFIRRNQLSVTLQAYTISGNNIDFFDSLGNRIA